MRSLSLRPIPVLFALASLTLAACDDTSDSTTPVTGPDNTPLSQVGEIPITDCGTVITQPGVYVMAADFGVISPTGVYCRGPVIDIRVSNVTIRGSSGGVQHGVDGNGGPCIIAGVGVPGGVSHIRLIDVDLRVCHGGAIVFENVSAGVVEKSTIRFNDDGGIVIQGSPALSRGDTIRNNHIDDNDLLINAGSNFIVSDNIIAGSGRFPDRGVVILSGAVTHSTIQRNTFTGPFARIDVRGNRNTVVSNTLNGGSQSAIEIWGQRNAIIENRIHGPGDYGVLEVYTGAYNTFRGNTVENVGIGIEQVGGYAVIKGNTVQNNSGDGIRVFGFRTRITGNRVLNNGEAGIGDEAGIHVFGNLGAVIAENTVLNNSVLDLLDDGDCGANTWRGNVFGTASASCIH